MHAVPQRHCQGVDIDGERSLGPAAARRPVAGDARRVDLRPRPGGAESDRLRRQVLPARAHAMNALTRNEIASLEASIVRFELNGREIEARADRTLIEIADAEGIAIPRLCYRSGLDKVGNCRSCMVEIA